MLKKIVVWFLSFIVLFCTVIIPDFSSFADAPEEAAASGTGQQTTGNFVSASTSGGLVTVDCGFEPDYIQVILPFNNGNTYAIYDAEISTTVSTWYIPMENRTYTIDLGSGSGETGIQAITSNGFVFRSNAGNTQNVTCTYVASDGVNKYVFIDDIFNSYQTIQDGYYNSQSNYDSNYNDVQGVLKNAVYNRFTPTTSDIIYNTYWGNDNVLSDLNNYLFKDCKIYLPQKDGYIYNDTTKLYTFFGDASRTFIAVIYSDSQPFVYDNKIYCSEPFNIAVTYYNNVLNDDLYNQELWFNELAYFKTDYYEGALDNNLNCYVLDQGFNPTSILASNIPVYFSIDSTYNGEAQTLAETYNLTDRATYLSYILNNNDPSGFVVDRNITKLTNNNNSNNNGTVINEGFDPNLFKGVLGFNWFNPSATLNYNQRTDNYSPYYILKYKLNNYTDIHKTECSIIVNAGISLRTELDSSTAESYNNIYTSTFYSCNTEYLLNSITDDYITVIATTNSSTYWESSYTRSSREWGQSSSMGDYQQFTGNDLTLDIYNAIRNAKGFNGGLSVVDSGTYAYFNLQFYIRNNVTGEISQLYEASFDMLKNTIEDNRNNIVSNDDDKYQQFIHSFDVLDDGDDKQTIDYANTVTSNSGDNNNVINIQNPQYPYVLVDIPENEWINKTPNLKNMLTDFKDMLAETQEGSILTMLPATYSYLPEPVWNYILYGVGICVMIGIWHAITRR